MAVKKRKLLTATTLLRNLVCTHVKLMVFEYIIFIPIYKFLSYTLYSYDVYDKHF